MSIRAAYFLGFVVVCVLLAVSVYLEVVVGIMPCPLCSLQRIMFILIGICFFIGIFLCTRDWGKRLINSLILLASLVGSGLAGRQVWLQYFPTKTSVECGASLQYMLQTLPFHELVKKILEGNVDCAKIGWTFLYLNMAEWALVWFVVSTLWVLHLFLKEEN